MVAFPDSGVILSVLAKDLDTSPSIEILCEYAQDDVCWPREAINKSYARLVAPPSIPPALVSRAQIRCCASTRLSAQRVSKSKYLISTSQRRNVARSGTVLRNTSGKREKDHCEDHRQENGKESCA
jgi:hypothetical protein